MNNDQVAVPKLGTYQAQTSGGILYEFTIKSADPNIGDIRGTYTTHNSIPGSWTSHLGDYPGDLIQSERSSSYSWIARTEHGVRINEPPFLIRIVGTMSKADGQKFWHCQQSWVGVYHLGDTIELGGTEVYLESNPGQTPPWPTKVAFLGPLQFKWTK